MRNKNVESLRGIAILLLLFYHYTISLNVFSSMKLIMMDEAFCQFAMVTFFTISGFGTFLHYQKRESRGERIRFLDYIKRRFIKIAPAYYFCMAFLILFTTGGVYLSRNGLKSILVFGTFTQNLFPSVSGDINGVTWTIALFLQFYIISYPVYRIIKKWGWKTYPFFLLFSLLVNKGLCMIVAAKGYPDYYYVIASIRQIFTTIDIFALGMICGSLMERQIFDQVKKEVAIILSLGIFALAVLAFIAYSFKVGGIWGNSFKFFLWKPFVNFAIVFIILLMAPCRIEYKSLVGRTIQFVSKVEYNTYLWHMVLFGNIKNTSALYFELAERTPLGAACVMMLLAIIVGYFSTLIMNNFQIQNVLLKE